MMTLVTMLNHSPDNMIKKNLTVTTTYTGTLRDSSSIVDPVILVECTNPSMNVNYAKIEEFGRYYFVTEIVSVRTDLWEFHLHCDVLKSFEDAILNSDAIISKSESNWNMYLHDQDYKCFQDPIIMNKEFPQGFDLSNSTFVLAVVGDSEPV